MKRALKAERVPAPSTQPFLPYGRQVIDADDIAAVTAALQGELAQELPLPAHFEQATEQATAEEVCKEMTCGPDPAEHLKAIQKYMDAGFTHIYIHQIGPDQDGFFDFYGKEILPRFEKEYA